MVTDSGANILKAAQLMRIRRIACFAHTMNLAVTHALECEELKEVIANVKKVVNIFRTSILAANQLKECQKDLKMDQLKVVQDVCTRWNSFYYCIKRLLQNNAAIEMALARLGKSLNALSQYEIDILKDLCKLLEPFEEATKITSGEKYATSSIIIPTIDGLWDNLENLLASIETPEVLVVATELKRQIINRLFPYESDDCLKMATILDPRIKLHGFKETQSSNAKDLLIKKLTAQMNTTLATNNKNAPTKNQDVQSSSGGVHLLSRVEIRRNKNEQVTSATASAIIAVQQYTGSKCLSMDENPFEFWENYPVPELKYLAKKFLCIPAT